MQKEWRQDKGSNKSGCHSIKKIANLDTITRSKKV